MQVYTYNEDGYFSGIHECQKCPETGSWLYPIRYTKMKIPTLSEFQLAKWDGTKWNKVDSDFRKDVWNKETGEKSKCETILISDEFTFIEKPVESYYTWQTDNWKIDFDLYKVYKSKEIKDSFENAIGKGSFTSTALGIEVDCRRDVMKNDLQNVQGLISYMERNEIETVDYVGYSEIKTGATIEMLTSLCAEMEDYVLELYQKKWTLQSMINSAITIEDFELINWEE